MELGNVIAQLRNQKELNQRELAQSLGVSNGAVAMWETNKRQPDIEMLKKISNFFHVSVDYLLGIEKPKKTSLNEGNKLMKNSIRESIHIRDYELADWKYEKIMEEIYDFEQNLDEEHEIALKLTSFGSSLTMIVTSIGYQNPDMLYFYGLVNGKDAQLIQHISQLNFLLTSVERKDKSKPIRRIGFRLDDEEA